MESAVSMLSSVNSSSLCSIEDVENRLRRLLLENANLRTTLQQNNLYMNQLKETLLGWQHEVIKLQEENRNKSLHAKDVIQKLRNENKALKTRLQENAVSYHSLETPNEQSQELSLSSEPADLGSFIVIQESSRQEADLPSPLENVRDPLYQQLQQENEALRSELRAEFERSKKDRRLLTETQSQLDQLTVSHEELMKQWAALSSSQHLTAESEEKCASLNARLISAEKLLLAKQQEISQLQNELTAVRAQAELFSSDFEAERRDRERLASEKEQLARQIREMTQQRNTPERSNHGQRLECPVCNMSFSAVNALENHVEDCLRNDTGMFP